MRRSDDGGTTWPLSLTVWEGPSAYSSLLMLPDGKHLGILYERGETPRAALADSSGCSAWCSVGSPPAS